MVVQIPVQEQIHYFLSHQPPVFGVVIAYALVCLLLLHLTRFKAYFFALLGAGLYVLPLYMH
jgi:hypothetical protein